MRILLAIISVAAAAGVARGDAPKAKCKPVGKAVVEMANKTAGKPTDTMALFANGAWTYEQFAIVADPNVEESHGQPALKSAGCLDASTAAKAKTAFAAIDWTVKHARVHCMAVSADSRDFSSGGTFRFTQTLCGADSLAEPSMLKLDAIADILESVTAPTRMGR